MEDNNLKRFSIKQTNQYGINLLFEINSLQKAIRVSNIKILINSKLFYIFKKLEIKEKSFISTYIPKKILKDGENIIQIETESTIKIKNIKTQKFFLEKQEKFFWCWAAVSLAILKYYNPNINWTQKKISHLMECEKCSTTLCECDKPRYIHKVLDKLNILKKAIPSQVSFYEIKEQLNLNRPVVTTIREYGINQGHLVIIVGVIKEKKLVVWDSKVPLYQYIDFYDFCDNYNKKGIWINTFFTIPEKYSME